MTTQTISHAQRQPNGFRAGLHRDRVIFRKWRDEWKDVIALFPDLDEGQGNVTSYAHVGQHGAAWLDGVLDETDPATPEEYAPLKRELEQRGYNLDVIEPDRMPNGFRRGLSPKKAEWDSTWGLFAMPNWTPIREVKFSRVYPSHRDVEEEMLHHYGMKPQHIIFLDKDRIKVVYRDVEFIMTRLEFLNYTDPRKKNGFRSSFQKMTTWTVWHHCAVVGEIILPDKPTRDAMMTAFYKLTGQRPRVATRISKSIIRAEFHDGKVMDAERDFPGRLPNGFRAALSYPASGFNDYQVEELGSDGKTTIGWSRIKLDIEKEVQHGWIPSSKVRMALKIAKILPQVDLAVLDKYVHIRPVMGKDRTYVATSWMTGREATFRISPYEGSSWSKKRKPNGFRRSISQIVPRNIRGWKRDKTIVANPLYEVYTVPHPTLPGWKIAFIKVAPGVGKIFGNVWSYAGGMVDPIYGLSGMHRFGTPDEALNYIDAQIASQTTWRKPNGFRAAIEGQTEDHDPGLLRWNVQTPEELWTHVFLPKNPTFAQIATALGRDPRDVYDVRKKSTGSILTVEFDDGDLFTMNRVW